MAYDPSGPRRPYRLDPAMCARIHARKRDGLSANAISRELGVSRPSVTKVLRQPDPGSEARDAKRRVPDPDATPLEDAMDQPDELEGTAERLAGREGDTADTVQLLSDTLKELRDMAADARDEDKGAYLAITRQIVQVGKELVRHIPPPAPDPETDPRNVAAAALFRERLRGMLDQRRGLLAELAEWRAV